MRSDERFPRGEPRDEAEQCVYMVDRHQAYTSLWLCVVCVYLAVVLLSPSSSSSRRQSTSVFFKESL